VFCYRMFKEFTLILTTRPLLNNIWSLILLTIITKLATCFKYGDTDTLFCILPLSLSLYIYIYIYIYIKILNRPYRVGWFQSLKVTLAKFNYRRSWPLSRDFVSTFRPLFWGVSLMAGTISVLTNPVIRRNFFSVLAAV